MTFRMTYETLYYEYRHYCRSGNGQKIGLLYGSVACVDQEVQLDATKSLECS